MKSTVGIDETLVGDARPGKRGRVAGWEVPVLAATLHDGNHIGRIRLARMADSSAESFETAVEETIVPGSVLGADAWLDHKGLAARRMRI